MKFRVLIEVDEDGVFVAQVPSLPGCVSQGATRAEALVNAREAIAGYVESLKAHDEPIPPSISEEILEVAPRVDCRRSRAARPVPRSRKSVTNSIARTEAT